MQSCNKLSFNIVASMPCEYVSLLSLFLCMWVCVLWSYSGQYTSTDWLFQSYHNPTQSSMTMIAMTANRKLQQYHPAWSNCSRTSSCGKILFCMQLLAAESIISHHQKAKHHHQQFFCIKFHSSIIIQKEEEWKKLSTWVPEGDPRQERTKGYRENNICDQILEQWGENGRKNIF